MMGLITEENLTLPYVVKGSHTGNDCDSLHGFQLKRNNADMNGIVKTALDKFKNQGVWVSDVKVNVNGMTVSWEVTIDKSSDGEFWNGFTSRGAGCNSDIQTRWNSESVGNGKQSIISKIIESNICNNVNSIQLVEKAEFTNLGDNSFIQGFYRYKCGDTTQSTSPSKKYVITGTDLTDLREKLSNETKNISIDENSIEFDTDNLTVKFNTGKTKIIKISLLFDNVSKENLDDRLKNAKVQNPTYKVIKRGDKKPYWWALSIIE